MYPSCWKLTKSLSFKVGGAFRNELSTPPLQKTINSKEDVRSHLFEEQENLGSPQLEAAISVIPLVRTTSYSALLFTLASLFIYFAGLQTELTRFGKGEQIKSWRILFRWLWFSVYFYKTACYWRSLILLYIPGLSWTDIKCTVYVDLPKLPMCVCLFVQG